MTPPDLFPERPRTRPAGPRPGRAGDARRVHPDDVDAAELARGAAGEARRRADRDPDPAREPRVVPYTGFASDRCAHLLARVVLDPPAAPPSPRDGRWRNLLATWRRFETDEVPAARVRLAVDDDERVVVANREGYVTATLPLAAPPAAADGWATARLHLAHPRGTGPARAAHAPVLVPPAGARLGVISDLDDTVLRSDVTRPLRMALTLALRNAHTRLPFEGIAAFYRALRDAPGGPNPLFYVSSSPWNLYDMLADFLRLQEIPHGPLLLRDWGVRRSRLPFGHGTHKRAAIDRILRTFPQLPFLLVGDSGQEDPEIYASVVRDWPGRVLAVYIRDVTGTHARAAAIRALAAETREAGVELRLVPDTFAAARHAAERGWIAAASLDEIAAERELDRR